MSNIRGDKFLDWGEDVRRANEDGEEVDEEESGDSWEGWRKFLSGVGAGRSEKGKLEGRRRLVEENTSWSMITCIYNLNSYPN